MLRCQCVVERQSQETGRPQDLAIGHQSCIQIGHRCFSLHRPRRPQLILYLRIQAHALERHGGKLPARLRAPAAAKTDGPLAQACH